MVGQNIVNKIELPSSCEIYTTTAIGSFDLPIGDYKAGQVVNSQFLEVSMSQVSNFDINKVFIQQQISTLNGRGDSILDVRPTMLLRNTRTQLLMHVNAILMNDLKVTSSTSVKFVLNISVIQN